MELNKRKSLLTPASPTAWGMIHGDISNQQDIIEKIGEVVKTNVDLTGYATESWVKKQNYLTEHQSLADYYTKSEVDEAISNIDVDTSELATKQELQNLKNNEVQTALSKSDSALTTANSAEQKIIELRTYVDEQIGEINTITEDILG